MNERPPPIPSDRVISMTELQKLSLKKLREMRLHEAPLVVRDVKAGRRRFVILDHESYERLGCRGEGAAGDPRGLAEIDFSGRGLLWDRPEMTNERFAAILGDPVDPEHRWAWGRALERLPSRFVTRALGLEDLRRLLRAVSLRPRLRAAWEAAVEFWTEEARRRRA